MVPLPTLSLSLLIFEVVFCDWRVDLTIEATLLYFAEVRGNSFCCCDDFDTTCAQNLTSLPSCAVNENRCDTVATIFLSGCHCPGICCIESSDIGNHDHLTFHVTSFPISETPATTSVVYLIVILEESDENSPTHEMDLVTVAIPFHPTDTTIQFMAQTGLNGIVEFTVSYDIYCNSDPGSSPDPCQLPSASIFTNPTYSTSPLSASSDQLTIIVTTTLTETIIDQSSCDLSLKENSVSVMTLNDAPLEPNSCQHPTFTTTHILTVMTEGFGTTYTEIRLLETCIASPTAELVTDGSLAWMAVAITTTTIVLVLFIMAVVTGCLFYRKYRKKINAKVPAPSCPVENLTKFYDEAETRQGQGAPYYASLINTRAEDHRPRMNLGNYAAPAGEYEVPRTTKDDAEDYDDIM